jgi:hypothetical protein
VNFDSSGITRRHKIHATVARLATPPTILVCSTTTTTSIACIQKCITKWKFTIGTYIAIAPIGRGRRRHTSMDDEWWQ